MIVGRNVAQAKGLHVEIPIAASFLGVALDAFLSLVAPGLAVFLVLGFDIIAAGAGIEVAPRAFPGFYGYRAVGASGVGAASAAKRVLFAPFEAFVTVFVGGWVVVAFRAAGIIIGSPAAEFLQGCISVSATVDGHAFLAVIVASAPSLAFFFIIAARFGPGRPLLARMPILAVAGPGFDGVEILAAMAQG